MSTPDQQEPQVQSDLKPVRVVFRQLDYITKGRNPLGQEVDVIRTAYGPGNPKIDPERHPELEVGSAAYRDMVSDFQHGEMIMLRPEAYSGLILSGAVKDVQMMTDEETGEEVEDFEDEEVLDISTATVDQLVEWIQTERPTVNDVVQASGGEPELARKLLEAESQATNGEPRKGVLEGLSAVISRG